MALKFNTFRAQRYLRSKFVEGKFLLASEATDLELEILDLLKKQVRELYGDAVAVEDSWKVEKLSDTQLLIKPGEAWVNGFPFIMRGGKDHLVSGTKLAIGTVPVGVSVQDDATGLGKILTFGTNSTPNPNDGKITPANDYRIIITAREELITDVQDPFLKNVNLTESTAQKIRVVFQLNIVPESIQTESPIPYRDESSVGVDPTLTPTNFPDTGNDNQPNFVNKIVITPAAGVGELLAINAITGSEGIDGKDLELIIANPLNNNPIPNSPSAQDAFSNGTLIDSNGTRYHINFITNDAVSGQVKIVIDKEYQQENPVIDAPGGRPYTLIKRDLYATDDINGVPQGKLHYDLATVSWNPNVGFAHQHLITDRRKVVKRHNDLQDLLADKLDLFLVAGGNLSWNATNNTLTWSSDLKLISPYSPVQTITAGSAPLVDGGSLIYEMDLINGGVLGRGTVSISSTSTGTTITLTGAPDLSQVRIGNVVVDDNGGIATITAIDDVNDTLTVSSSLTFTAGGTIYLDSYAPNSMPKNLLNFVVAVRDGSKVYVGINDLELEDGETNQLGDGISLQNLTYIGATGETDSSPNYSSANIVTQGGSLTQAIGELDSSLDALIATVNNIQWKNPVANFASLPTTGNSDGDVRLVLDTRIAYHWDNAQSLWLPLTGTGAGLKLIGGGVVSWDSVSGNLSFTADMYLEKAGLAYTDNTIPVSASPIILANDKDVAYVTPNLVSGGGNLTVTVDVLQNVPLTAVIIARRDGNDVIVGSISTRLKSGESKLLYQGLTNQEEDKLYGLKTAFFRADNPVTWTGTQIQFTSDIVLDVLKKDGTEQSYTVLAADSPITLNNGEYAYLTIDRNSNAQTLSFTVGAAPAEAAAGSEVIIFAKRQDALGVGYLHLPLHKQVLEPGQTIRLGVGGGGGAGDANSFVETLKNRLNDSIFEAVTPYVAETNKDDATYIDPASTGTFDLVVSRFKLANIGDTLVSAQMLDSTFLAGSKGLAKAELIVKWDDAGIDTGATYELSKNGGTTYEPVTMVRIDNSGTYRGILDFGTATSSVLASITSGTVQQQTLNATTQSRLAAKFVLNKLSEISSVKFNIESFAGTIANNGGRIFMRIVKDNAGVPSTNAADIVYESKSVAVAGLTTGVLSFTLSTPLAAGTYHAVILSDATYKADLANGSINFTGYTAGNGLATYDEGTGTWTNQDPSALYHSVEGVELDLRVRITSSATDRLIEGFGIFYEENVGNLAFATTVDGITKVSFKAVADNLNEFTLPFLPNPDLLVVHLLESGQSFRYGDFTLQGNTVIFPPNQFNNGGVEKTQTLIFDQIRGGAFDNSDVNASLLAANHLGSTDGSIDKSVAGRGIFLRRPDGTLREIAIDDNDNIVIYSI